MEEEEGIVIVGAGISGLSTAVGLHRLGIRSRVLESSETLRVTRFALTTWFNAWKAMDALGVSQHMRNLHFRLQGWVVGPISGGAPTIEMLFPPESEEYESRCVERKVLLEALAGELPQETIRFSSKVVHIQLSGHYKLLHLSDGTILKTKVLVGCDGVNSVVGKWLGFRSPATTPRLAVRGLTCFPEDHGFGKRLQFYGEGVRCGFVPCDNNTVYWFLTHTSTLLDEGADPETIREFVLSKLQALPQDIKSVVENTDADSMVMSRLKYRPPWELLWTSITRDNVCVAGDALHPMTPDIQQGGCSALEDGVILARCLGGAVKAAENLSEDEEGYKRIEEGMKRYARERKWRSIDLIATAYTVGLVQQSGGKWMQVLRDMFLSSFLSRLVFRKAHFDCGSLVDEKPFCFKQ